MSSASSGRYQSRLFNFVHQQSRRLTEKCERAVRELQVATSWVAPVVLYPIYLLLRSTRAVVKQVHQAMQQSWLQLESGDESASQPQTPPTASMSVKPVRTEVRMQQSRIHNISSWLLSPVSSPLTGRSRSPKLNRPVIRGIATQLSSRTLVLVTAENEILENLTPQQQQKLQELITGEVSEYWRYQRLAHSARLHLPIKQGELIPYPDRALAFLDRTFAQLESNYLVPVSEVAIALGFIAWELVGRVQSQLKLPADSKPRRKPLPHRRSASKLPDSQLPSRPQLQSPDIVPWLMMGDLFGDAESEGEPSTKSQTPTKLAGKTNPDLPASQSAWGGHPARHPRNLLNKLGLPTPYSPLPKSPRRDRCGEISHQPRSQSTRLDPAPDWLETQATAVGYVKHPLEQLLEWLDRAMLWLEDVLMIVWRWVQQLWRGK